MALLNDERQRVPARVLAARAGDVGRPRLERALVIGIAVRAHMETDAREVLLPEIVQIRGDSRLGAVDDRRARALRGRPVDAHAGNPARAEFTLRSVGAVDRRRNGQRSQGGSEDSQFHGSYYLIS